MVGLNINFNIFDCFKLLESEETRHVLCPGRNVKKLEIELRDLVAMKRDVETELPVKVHQQPGMVPKNRVVEWIKTVAELESEAKETLESLARRKRSYANCCLCGSRSSNYRLGKDVADFLDRAGALKSQHNDWGDVLVVQTGGGTIAQQLNSTTSQDVVQVVLEDDDQQSSSDESEEGILMDDVIASRLKYSYDSLDDDRTRSCFLYCCLHSERENIKVEDLVEYWIGEGLLNAESIHEARRTGLRVIEELKLARLLETGSRGNWYVKLNKAARYMALRMTRVRRRRVQEAAFLVFNKKDGLEMRNFRRWDLASRVSLMWYDIEGLPADQVPNCPKLLTLLMRGNSRLAEIREGFFQSMPLLRVLDLSFTNLARIPSSIRLLAELQYLSLRKTPVEELPAELGELKKLKQIDLSTTVIFNIIKSLNHL